MSLARLLVLALVVFLPLTASLAFAAGDILVPRPWSKHSQSTARAAVRLPSGIAPATPAAVGLPLLGAPVTPPAAASIALQPPFVPPRG